MAKKSKVRVTFGSLSRDFDDEKSAKEFARKRTDVYNENVKIAKVSAEGKETSAEEAEE